MLRSGSCITNIALYLPGLASNVVPMFLGEMAPKNLRGAIGVVPQLFITIGILIAQILGLHSILGNAEGKILAWEVFCGLCWGKISPSHQHLVTFVADWPVMLGLTGIPSVIQLLTLPFFPESPRYLLIQKGNEEQARQGTAPSFTGRGGGRG